MTMNIKRILIALLINLTLAGAALAATPEQAKALVEKALAYVKANGTEKSL